MHSVQSLTSSEPTSRWGDGPFRRGDAADSFKIRIWELIMLLVVLQGYHYWYRVCRTKISLGIYLAFTLSFGWTWIIDGPLLFRLTFQPHSLPAPFGTMLLHREALWTAPSYTAVAFWVMLHHHQRKRGWVKFLDSVPGWVGTCAWGLALGVGVMLLEGCVGNSLLQIEDYYYRESFMLLGVPWTNTFLFIPFHFVMCVFFVDKAYEVHEFEEDARKIDLSQLMDTDAEKTPLLGGSWASFCTGFAAVQAGYYVTLSVMIPILQFVQPWETL